MGVKNEFQNDPYKIYMIGHETSDSVKKIWNRIKESLETNDHWSKKSFGRGSLQACGIMM